MTDTTRDLLIILASHMAYMQGQLEARHELDDPEDYYWYRESVLLRQKVADHLAAEAQQPSSSLTELRSSPPTVMEIIELSEKAEAAGLGQVDFARAVLARWGTSNLTELRSSPDDGEAAELVAWIRGMYWAHPDKERATRAADLLQRLNPPQPVPVSERLPGPKDCDANDNCWWFNPDDGDGAWYLDTPYTPFQHWLPAHALPLPEVGE